MCGLCLVDRAASAGAPETRFATSEALRSLFGRRFSTEREMILSLVDALLVSEGRCRDWLLLCCLLCVLLVVLPPVQDLERRVEIIGVASAAPSGASHASLPSGRWLDATCPVAEPR